MMVTWARMMAKAMTMVGDKEGNSKGRKSDGDGDGEGDGGWQQ